MTSVIVPPVDLAPGMPSRVVTISATDVTEGGQSLAGQMVRFALSDTLDVTSGGDVIAKTQAEVVLDADGNGSIRLPVYTDAVKTWCGDPDWAIIVTTTWGSQKAIRVPAGTSSIALSALPPVRPLRGRERQWAITGVSVTVTEGAQAGGTASLQGGVIQLGITIPPFDPATVEPYVDREIRDAGDRMLGLVEAEPAFAVVDAELRRTWIEADQAGRPTLHAAALIREAIGESGGGSALALPTDDWAHWGDSLTDERVTGSEGWVTKLSAMTGRSHYNGGWYGQKTVEIAARQGSLPAVVTVDADTIPASGAVAVTAIRNSPVEQHASLGVYGTLAGVHGFMQEPTTNVTTFTRTVPGDPVACPPGTRFTPDDGATMRDRTVTIWAGRNDVYTATPQMIVSAIQAQIDFLAPAVKRAMVLEVVPSESSPATHPQLAAINTALQNAFPAEWLPIATWLRTPAAATAAGITFTTEDNADIAAGITPRSFRSDTVHLNGVGCTAVAHRVYIEAQGRGWIA